MATTDTLRKHFRAPWGWKLWALTLVAGGALGAGFYATGAIWVRVLLGGILAFTFARAVRGYSVQDGAIHVHRLGWAKQIDLDDVQDVEIAPGVMTGSIRTFGNGGLFAFTGWYRNSTLGSYRAYATKGDNTVVLRTTGGPIVITPDDPAGFVEAVRAGHNDLA
jgi:hypothetical protein